MNKKEKTALSKSHDQLISALESEAVKKEFSEKNKFNITSNKGYGAVLSQLKKEKKFVDSMVGNLDKAKKEFSRAGGGGTEYEALQQALQQLNMVELKVVDGDYDHKAYTDELEKSYSAVEMAALAYVETHNRHHATLQGSRRLKYAKILAENIRNREYLKERQINLKEEISFAKEDTKKKYVKDDKTIKVTPKGITMCEEDQEAIKFYSMEKMVISEEEYEAGIHIGPYHEYNPYQFVNGIRRGIIKKEEVEQFKKQIQTLKLKTLQKKFMEITLNRTERMDHLFDNNQGLESTTIVYRGIGASQIKSMLNLSNEELSNTKAIAENLESLVGKVFTDKGFISTSRDKKVAEDFARKSKSPFCMMMEIVARKGTPMINLSGVSLSKTEKEHLVKDGTKMLIRGFSIKHFKDDDGKDKPLIVLKAEMRKSEE